MLVREIVQIGEEGSKRNFIHNYSDAGMFIERDGELYEDALDPEQFSDRVYKETDIPVFG